MLGWLGWFGGASAAHTSVPVAPRDVPVAHAAVSVQPSVQPSRRVPTATTVVAPPIAHSAARPKVARRGPTHAPKKWRAPAAHVDEESAARGACARCAGARAAVECPECRSGLCVDCEQTAVHTCWFCARTACTECTPWYQADVQSSSWKGEERPMPFCTEDCAHASLARCQRADNPVTRLE